MGVKGPNGIYDYYGRPLAIMVRFPGNFLETAAPSVTGFNQIFLLVCSGLLLAAAALLWKYRGGFSYGSGTKEKRRRRVD